MSPLHDHPVRLTVRRYTTGRVRLASQRTVLYADGTPVILGDRATAQRLAEHLTALRGCAHFVEDYIP